MIRYRDTLAAHGTSSVLHCAGSRVRCRKPALIGTFSHRDHAGINSLRFTGRLHGDALRPGRYLLKVTATLAGQRSPAVTTSFVILAPPPVCNDPDNDGDCDTTAHAAATPSCGMSCTDLSDALYGTSSNPAFVLANVPQAENVGQPLTLAAPSNSNQGEDFTIASRDLVSDYIAAGIIAQGMSPYDPLDAFEIDYTPFGVGTGLCVGLGATPADGTGAGLEPCGVSARTLWIIDSQLSGPELPLISGATESNFSDPFVLSALAPGFPLFTSTMHISGGGTVLANQLWGASTGVLP
jgi:hypothetical protein